MYTKLTYDSIQMLLTDSPLNTVHGSNENKEKERKVQTKKFAVGKVFNPFYLCSQHCLPVFILKLETQDTY